MNELLEYLLPLVIAVFSFVAGLKLANHYNSKAQLEMKEALERQYVRLIARTDADDPCKPYIFRNPTPLQPVTQRFMDELKANGKAKTSFRKSDLAK